MNIREATESDIPAISEIIKTSYATVAQRYNLTPENCPKHPSNCTNVWVDNDFHRGVRYFVIESCSRLIGCIALEIASETSCYLERLAVIPEERNKRAGTKLVNSFIRKATELGLHKIGIGIISKQSELKQWYQNIGFVETGTKSFDHLPFEVTFLEYHI